MPVSEETYEQLALEDPEGQWELVCGRPRSKPGMTFEHNQVQLRLARQLILQLDESEYVVSPNVSRLRVSSGSFYIPDLCVLPVASVRRRGLEAPRRLEVYDEPMPLVVEVWSPSTGDYDVEEKLGEYRRRGDTEIWRLHPYDKTLTAWRRRSDGSYAETTHQGGSVQPIALPGVTIELDRLFA